MSEKHPSPFPWEGRSVDTPVEASWAPPVAPPQQIHREEGGRPGSVQRYVSSLFRYKWILVFCTVMGIGGAYAVWTQAQPTYVAQGSLWIQAPSGGEQGPIVTQGLLQARAWLDLLLSYSVLDSVALSQRLHIAPSDPQYEALFEDFELDDTILTGTFVLQLSEDGSQLSLLHDQNVRQRAAPGDSIGRELGFRWAPEVGLMSPGEEVEFTVRSPRDAANRLRESLNVQMDQAGSFIRLEVRDGHPRRAANIVNAIMERHVALAAELKQGNLNERSEILTRQLDQVENELAEAEGALESFRVETITLPSEESAPIQAGLEMTRDPVFAQFFQMRVDQEELRRDRQRLEEVMEDLPERGVEPEALQFIPSVVNSPQIQAALADLAVARAEFEALRRRYTLEHPPVMELAETIETLEQDRIPMLLSRLVEQLQVEEGHLADRLAASGEDLSEIPPRAIQEAGLRRRVAIADNLYTDLRSRFEEASLAQASSVPDVRVLDRATIPQFPANDQRMRLVVMVLFGFMGAGVGGILLADRLDSRLRSPEEVPWAVGLSLLGAIPRVRKAEGPKQVARDLQLREAFRELRTSVDFAYGAAGPIILTVSSPGVSEGKTTVTTNLGISFAQLGRRTLLIDGDTRRGDLHALMEGSRKPGLTDYLAGAVEGDEVIQATPHENLDFIGAGTYVENSPELLSSSRMGEALSALRRRYDVILLDSPPFGAGADSLVLSAIAGHLLLVLRSGSTDIEFAQAKLEPLERLPVRILGVVLNDYVPGRMTKYQYYGNYLPGYEAGAEKGELVALTEG